MPVSVLCAPDVPGQTPRNTSQDTSSGRWRGESLKPLATRRAPRPRSFPSAGQRRAKRLRVVAGHKARKPVRFLAELLAPILTDDVIAEVLLRAEQTVCPPGDARCDGFAFGVAEALSSLTPDGWCEIGWVAASAGRETWDVSFHVDTGKTRHIKQPKPP